MSFTIACGVLLSSSQLRETQDVSRIHRRGPLCVRRCHSCVLSVQNGDGRKRQESRRSSTAVQDLGGYRNRQKQRKFHPDGDPVRALRAREGSRGVPRNDAARTQICSSQSGAPAGIVLSNEGALVQLGTTSRGIRVT